MVPDPEGLVQRGAAATLDRARVCLTTTETLAISNLEAIRCEERGWPAPSSALSVIPTERRRVVTIAGQVTEREAAEVLITLEGRTLHTVCLFGDTGDLDVLGAYTLEGFGLGIDPVQRKLIPALQYGAAVA
jgi:hypothetical protein